MVKTYGLIGRRLGHSFSALYFNEKFGRENIPARYDLFPIEDISLLPSLLSQHSSLCGLNVTIPYKQEILPYLDDISEEAKEIGAVNVVKIERGESGTKLSGFNSDVYGFSVSLLNVVKREGMKQEELSGREALVLGTGGASKAAVWALSRMGIRSIVVGRKRKDSCIAYEDLTPQQIWDASIVVNCTPAGMSPNVVAAPPFPFEYLHEGQICFDLIYNPTETLFMKIAKSHGCAVENGLMMLHLQAERSWEIWKS